MIIVSTLRYLARASRLRRSAADPRGRLLRGQDPLEDFDVDAQPAIRQQAGALASGGFLTEPATSCCSARLAPERLPSRPHSGSPLPGTDIACCSPPPATGSPA